MAPPDSDINKGLLIPPCDQCVMVRGAVIMGAGAYTLASIRIHDVKLPLRRAGMALIGVSLIGFGFAFGFTNTFSPKGSKNSKNNEGRT